MITIHVYPNLFGLESFGPKRDYNCVADIRTNSKAFGQVDGYMCGIYLNLCLSVCLSVCSSYPPKRLSGMCVCVYACVIQKKGVPRF